MPALTVLFAQGASVLPDTIVARLVAPQLSWFAQATDIASGVLTMLAVLLFVGAVWAALRMRRSFDRAQAMLEEVARDLRVLIERANGIAQNAGAIGEALKADLTEVRETVDFANQRARRAVSVMADRVDEFNDALATVQRDTQGIVVTALAAFRGLRAGMSAMRRKGRKNGKPQPAEMVFAEDDDEPENDLPARPRLRRRARADR